MITPTAPTPSHPWSSAIHILRFEAQVAYRVYETRRDNRDQARAAESYNRYVELNTAAAFLGEHPPSGVLPVYDPSLRLPPKHIADAARLVELYFRQQGMDDWEFAGLRSRNGSPRIVYHPEVARTA